MSSGSPKRTRSDRVAALELPPSTLGRFFHYARSTQVLTNLGLCVLAMVIMWTVTHGWAPPLGFRLGDTPSRDIVVAEPFDEPNKEATLEAKAKAKREITCVYDHDPNELRELRNAVKSIALEVVGAESWEKMDSAARKDYFPVAAGTEAIADMKEQEAEFLAFRNALPEQADRARFEAALEVAFADFERDGILEKLHSLGTGDQSKIDVHPQDGESYKHIVLVKDAFLPNVKDQLEKNLRASLSDAERVPLQRWLQWVRRSETSQLPITLTFNPEETRKVREKAAEDVPQQFTKHIRGVGEVLAEANKPLSDASLARLKLEYQARREALTWTDLLRHSLAALGMYVALYTLCGCYIFFRHPQLLANTWQFARLLGLIVVTVALCWTVSGDTAMAEIVPLTLFGLIATIAYQREFALLLSACVALVVVISMGGGLSDFVVLVATVASAVMLLGRIRSRTKLIYVGLAAGVVTFATTIGVMTACGGVSDFALLYRAGWFGFCACLAGLLMTGLLPFVEKLFAVQTDLSLLELGDAAHPLLQELVRRAPGTYNHSINVASIAEAATEAIGGNSLLVRVGAYFHDIGKMLKPGYFIENQGEETNRHDALLPAMSTLVIIAHVKDGADLARQHHLPQPVIDFIQQHHGTTLVEFFFKQASQQKKDDPDAADVDEATFRYPGPKPQTKEAGVMMLADGVESACRTLVDPTPARIESLVHEIAQKRLLDGQFDECELTLKELRVIEVSLVKSLIAVYHSRVKYPDQQTA